MIIKLNIPAVIEVDDYHEFDYIKRWHKILNDKIKVEELCFDEDARKYVGIVFLHKDKDYKYMMRKALER